MNMTYKVCQGEIVEVKAGQREVVTVISTPVVDRDNEVVLPSGLERKNYAGLPVLFNHERDRVVAKSLWVKGEPERVIAKHRFSDATEFAKECFALAQDGMLNSYSIGFFGKSFSPPSAAEIAKNPAWKSAKNIIRQWGSLSTR